LGLSFKLSAFFEIPLGLIAQILEFFRGAAWIIFLLVVLNPQKQLNFILLLKSRTYVVIVITLLFLQFLAVIYSNVVIDINNVIIKQYSISGGWVGVSVIGMLLIEHLFRNIPDTNRWGIKFACLGIGGLFVYDFYLYSDAMLFNKVNIDIWTARGIVDALTVPLLAISVARNSLWSQGILVSRSVLFHSATLFGTAFYLMAMAAAGYYLRYFGGSWVWSCRLFSCLVRSSFY